MRFSSCALLFTHIPILSPPRPPLSEPSSGARGNLLLLFRWVAPYSMPPISLTLPYFPVVILDHRTSLHVPSILSSIPCHLEYHLLPPSLSSFRYCLMEILSKSQAERAGYLERMNEWRSHTEEGTCALREGSGEDDTYCGRVTESREQARTKLVWMVNNIFFLITLLKRPDWSQFRYLFNWIWVLVVWLECKRGYFDRITETMVVLWKLQTTWILKVRDFITRYGTSSNEHNSEYH